MTMQYGQYSNNNNKVFTMDYFMTTTVKKV